MLRRTAVLAVVALALAACSGDDGERDEAAFDPVFVEGPCDTDRVPDDPRLECGTLTVLEDRADPGGATIRLPVAIIRSADPDPAPDPIVYFSGGPGGEGLGIADAFLERDLGGPRDIVLFDQRGTGGADPSLECPEVDAVSIANFGTADPADVELDRVLDGYAACRERLVREGVDLDAYDTTATADDVDDLRVALGVDEWNIFGISYGTRVALEVLRIRPDTVRAAVLDSVTPPTGDQFAVTLGAAFRRVRQRLIDGCAAAPACAAAYPMLEADLEAVVDRFNAEPFVGSFTDPGSGEEVPIAITGNDILGGLFNALYDTPLIPLLPSFNAALRRGDTAIIPQLAAQGIPFVTQFADGMTASVECADFGRFDRIAAVEEALEEEPELSTILATSGIPQACELWDVEPAPAEFNEIPETDVPVLVLGDEYDPVTPPQDSRATAERLGEAATYVELPGLGHGAVLSHDCPESMFRAFVADPGAEVDTACVGAMPAPAWAVP